MAGGLPQLDLVLQRPHEGARRPRPAVLQVEPALALDLRGDGRVDDGVAALRGGLHHRVADDLVQDLGGENEKMPFFSANMRDRGRKPQWVRCGVLIHSKIMTTYK